jgi:hypothetical protein
MTGVKNHAGARYQQENRFKQEMDDGRNDCIPNMPRSPTRSDLKLSSIISD